jgi:CheY-like chemotaxis protein
MKKSSILLVEDNEGDIILTREAFESSKYIEKLTTLRDGQLAFEYLENCLKKDDSSLPDIVLLDINLPKKNGHEVLHFIKSHDQLKQLPVIMLSTSSSEKDVLEAYRNYANCFISKPIEVDHFMDVISKIEEFWLNTVVIPNHKK